MKISGTRRSILACLSVISSAACSSSPEVIETPPPLVEVALLQASNHDPADLFGANIAISADGSTLAIGAPGEDSVATGVDGDQTDNAFPEAGAVYVFVYDGAIWSQQAYLKPTGTYRPRLFGKSVALAADGATLAVGSPGGSYFAWSGYYMFTRQGTTWRQDDVDLEGFTGDGDGNGNFSGGPPPAPLIVGEGLALSADGAVVAVGVNHSVWYQGPDYVRVLGRSITDSGVVWAPLGSVQQPSYRLGDRFGASIALSTDASTMVVGVPGDSTTATGATVPNAGAAYVFTRSDAIWALQASLRAPNPGAGDELGGRVALSADGSTAAIGAAGEASAATGIDGDQADDSAPGAGAVYVFAYDGATWSRQAYVKAPSTGAGDAFGASLALTSDGSMLAIGAPGEDGGAAVVDGDPTDDSVSGAGAIYVLERGDATWAHRFYVKPSTAVPGGAFGASAALTADGSALAAGASGTSTAYVFRGLW